MNGVSKPVYRPLVLPKETSPLHHWNAPETDSFEKVADEVFAPIYKYILQDVIAAFGRSLSGLTVLEIGGGVGNMAVEFIRAGVDRLDALDISRHMLSKTVQRLSQTFQPSEISKKFRPFEGEAEQLPHPFSESSFDLVFSRGSIQFWRDIPTALAGIAKVLKSDGLAYLGGGFGLSTPPETKQDIIKEKERRIAEMKDSAPIPQLNKNELLNAALQLGGTAKIEIDGGGGFWLVWFPHRKGD